MICTDASGIFPRQIRPPVSRRHVRRGKRIHDYPHHNKRSLVICPQGYVHPPEAVRARRVFMTFTVCRNGFRPNRFIIPQPELFENGFDPDCAPFFMVGVEKGPSAVAITAASRGERPYCRGYYGCQPWKKPRLPRLLRLPAVEKDPSAVAITAASRGERVSCNCFFLAGETAAGLAKMHEIAYDVAKRRKLPALKAVRLRRCQGGIRAWRFCHLRSLALSCSLNLYNLEGMVYGKNKSDGRWE